MRLHHRDRIGIDQRAKLWAPSASPSATLSWAMALPSAPHRRRERLRAQDAIGADAGLAIVAELGDEGSRPRRHRDRHPSTTIEGALPPSSRLSFYDGGAHCAMSWAPNSVEPVNVSFADDRIGGESRGPMALAAAGHHAEERRRNPGTARPAGPGQWPRTGSCEAGLSTTGTAGGQRRATLRVTMALGNSTGYGGDPRRRQAQQHHQMRCCGHCRAGCRRPMRRASSANQAMKLAP